MKPPRFDYHAPVVVDECVRLKADAGPGAVFLAGGQSLVPLLNQRRIQPDAIIDLNRIAELQQITTTDDGTVRIGAMARQRAVAEHPGLAPTCPLLFAAIPFVGNFGTRNRGTLGGSLTYADPCAQLPAVALASEGVATVIGTEGVRTTPVAELFAAPFTTTLAADEMLVEVAFPAVPTGTVAAWQEIRTREFDFPRIGVGAIVTCDGEGRVERARLVATGTAERYASLDGAADVLIGRTLDDNALAAAGDAAAASHRWEPAPGAARYIATVLRTLTRRVLGQVKGRVADA